MSTRVEIYVHKEGLTCIKISNIFRLRIKGSKSLHVEELNGVSGTCL